MLSRLIFLPLLFLSVLLPGQGTLLNRKQRTEIEIFNCARVNDVGTQFGPALYKDQLVYVARPKRGNINPRTRQTYFKLFTSRLGRDGEPSYGKPFSQALTSAYNEGSPSFTQGDKVIFFTRTQLRNGVPITDAAGNAQLGIYSAYRAEYDWDGIRPLPFNGPGFSNQAPSVTPDGRRVFFASNRPGGYGGYDLYFSDFREGRWSPAVNLGPEINTSGNESYPYIHSNGRLFFASDGHGGMGGYDLYMIDLSQRRWGKLLNLPPPINSVGDDIGIVLTADSEGGYLVSNRPGGKGDDDIYRLAFARGFSTLEATRTDGALLTLYDAATSRRVADASVWIAAADRAGRLPADYYSFALGEKDGRRILVTKPLPAGALPPTALRTDREGSLRLELKAGTNYEVRVAKPGYAPAALRFAYTATGSSRPLAITLQPTDCREIFGRIVAPDGGGAGNVPVQFRPRDCPRGSLLTTTDLGGFYESCLPACSFTVTAGRSGFVTGTAEVPLAGPTVVNLPMVLQYEGGLARRGTEADEAYLDLPGIAYYGASGALNEANSGDINLLLRLLQLRPDFRLLLVAHVDGPGTPADLVRLGEQRAGNLREALLRRGVSPERLSTISYGNRYRLRKCTSCTTEEYAQNSRLEAKVIGW